MLPVLYKGVQYWPMNKVNMDIRASKFNFSSYLSKMIPVKG